MEFNERSWDEVNRKQGYKKCVCGHWDFSHENKFWGGKSWCTRCTCEKFKNDRV